ncbi:hypothetical protein B0H63DRAFT_510749 [Podospora didyma]|uniref:Uncharacterized protein n=1 Tax=Podospora didyma TaxID=330526 RepID=A0AAE0NRD9_9PEZI|nr:hypothetical protein B0H63DRAFT_510749 [Podospora didyma]
MSSRAIEYIWKVARPKNEAIAKALISYIHPSTRTRGVYVKDNPHLTLSVKNTETAKEGKHQTAHGYTPHINSFNVNNVVPSSNVKDDSMGNAWPAEMDTRPKDVVFGEPSLLGPAEDFITWPSEETGE